MRFHIASYLCLLAFSQLASARGVIYFNTNEPRLTVEHFRQLSKLIAPPTTTAAGTQCGYIFPGDPNKFGCKGVGPAAAADVAAACAGGGSLACTGSGSNRTCTCAFD